MTAKKPTPQAPAPTVAQDELLQGLELPIRELYYIQKVFRDGGDVNAAIAGSLERGNPDPSDASMQASVGVTLLGADLDFGSTFRGRKPGARAPETLYIEALSDANPHEDAADLYRLLRAIASNPGDRRNPTPGECPFGYRHRGVQPELLKRDKAYPFSTFKNALSKIRSARAKDADPTRR